MLADAQHLLGVEARSVEQPRQRGDVCLTEREIRSAHAAMADILIARAEAYKQRDAQTEGEGDGDD